MLEKIKYVYENLNNSSFILKESEKDLLKQFVRSSDCLLKYLSSRNISLNNLEESFNSKKGLSNPKLKHDLILSFSMFKIDLLFKEHKRTFIIEPEYRQGNCKLRSPDFVSCFDSFNFCCEVKTKIDSMRIDKAKEQIKNSFIYEPKCDFGFITTMKRKKLKLYPVVEKTKFNSDVMTDFKEKPFFV